MTAAVGQDPGGLVGEGVSGDEAGVWVSVALTPGGRLRSEKMAGNENVNINTMFQIPKNFL